MKHYVPPSRIVMRTTPWRLTVLLTSILVALVFLPPALSDPGRTVLMAGFSAICHQLPERSVLLDGVSLAVCSRCLGIYGGMLLGVLAFPWLVRKADVLNRSSGVLLLAGLVVPGADWLAGVLALWQSGHAIRIATGATFGVVAGYFIARGAVNLAVRRANPPEALHGT